MGKALEHFHFRCRAKNHRSRAVLSKKRDTKQNSPLHNKSKNVLSTYFLLILAQVFADYAGAQVLGGSISGTIMDQQREVLPSATVTAVQGQQNIFQTTTSNNQGQFHFAQLKPGTYSLRVEKTGFKTYEQYGIVLESNADITLGTIFLKVGSVTETVTIRSEGMHLDTENNERGFTVNNQQMEDVLVNGRSWAALAVLVPGVTTFGNYQTSSNNGLGSSSVNGNRTVSNQVTVDGLGNQDQGNNGDQLATVSTDNIQELRIVTDDFQAQYGRNTGSQTVIVTKSGTKEYHGEGYLFHRNEGLNANNWFNKRNGQPRNKFRFNDVGYNIGGPLQIPELFTRWRDKAFFYVGEEWQQQLVPESTHYTRVPTDLERNGDFSQSIDKNNNLWPYIRDYTTGRNCSASDTSGCFRDGGVLGRIPQARLYPLGIKAMQTLPEPNFTGGVGFNYISAISGRYPRREDILRVDFNPSERWKTYFRWLGNEDNAYSWYGTSQIDSGANIPISLDRYSRPATNMAIGITTILNATTTNQFITGYGKNWLHGGSVDDNKTKTTLGLESFPVLYPSVVQADLIPTFSFNGSRLANNAQMNSGGTNWHNAATDFEVSDNFNKMFGTHSTQFGVYLQHSRKDQIQYWYASGNYNFGDDSSNPYDSQLGLANFALGIYDTYQQANSYIYPMFQTATVEWYGQDSWRVTNKWTISYGVRFSWIPPEYEQNNNSAVFDTAAYQASQAVRLYQRKWNGSKFYAYDPATGQTLPAYAIGDIVPNSGNQLNGIRIAGKTIDKHLMEVRSVQYGPRLGMSYQLGDKTVFRGGGGAFYQRTSSNNEMNYSANVPFQYDETLYYGQVSDLASNTALLSPFGTRARQWSAKLPTTYDFNLELQQELPYQMLWTMAYVGSNNSHLYQQVNLNGIPYGATFQPQNQDPAKVAQSPNNRLGSNAYDENFIRPYIGYGDIPYVMTGGSSNYNSLQVTVNRRYAHGLFLGGAYTWGKALGVTTNEGDWIRIDGQTRKYNYGPLGFDRRHTFAVNYIYEFPFLFKPNSFLHTMVDGWQVSGITRFQTGAEFTPSASLPGYSNANITGSYSEGWRVQLVGNPYGGTSHDPYHRLNPQVFQAPSIGNIGSGIGLNSLTGPGINNTDLSLEKKFHVRERSEIQLRCDAFNVFNHPQFNGINSSCTLSGPGQTGCTNPAGPGNLTGFGSVSGANDPRILQLSTRIKF